MPRVRELAELNAQLLAGCQEDTQRIIGERAESAGVLMLREREHLRPVAKEGFDTEVSFPEVDSGGCFPVRTNRYSTPLRPGVKPQVKVSPAYVEVRVTSAATAGDSKFWTWKTTWSRWAANRARWREHKMGAGSPQHS